MERQQLFYAPPVTARQRVETEGGLCADSASIINDNSGEGKINQHKINTDGPSFGSNIEWDDNETTTD